MHCAEGIPSSSARRAFNELKMCKKFEESSEDVGSIPLQFRDTEISHPESVYPATVFAQQSSPRTYISSLYVVIGNRRARNA